jgi:hypothetical protein
MYIYCNKLVTWDESQNALLKERRGVSFEMVLEALSQHGPLWVKEHPSPDKYPGQRILAVLIGRYFCIVPYEETDDQITFRTVYPSRWATKAYCESKGDKNGSSS